MLSVSNCGGSVDCEKYIAIDHCANCDASVEFTKCGASNDYSNCGTSVKCPNSGDNVECTKLW